MTEIKRRNDEAQTYIQSAFMKECCEVMHKTGLPPMAVLRLAAQSLGAIYREIADAHSGPDACPCGWRPYETSDMEILGQALAAAARRYPPRDLRAMQTVGTA